MASNGVVNGVQSIIDTLFGCCVRPRRAAAPSNSGGFSSSDLARGDSNTQNERTPLLSGHKRAPSSANKVQSNNAHNGKASGSTSGMGSAPHGTEPAVSSGDKVKRRKDVDAGRLKTIRDHAQGAFFNIDSSQLLPSSSSLAQRQAGMGSSQRLGRRDQNGDGTEGEASYAAQQRAELIAASDKAERLYTAAMKTTNGDGAESDDGDNGKPVAAATSDAPVGLVRQVRLSVSDAKARQGGVREVKGTAPAANPAVDEAVLHESPFHVHSLRRLQLGVTPASSDVDARDDAAALLGASLHSTATQGDASENAVSGSSAEDGRWERRGRRRSHRGLIWTISQKEGDGTGVAAAQTPAPTDTTTAVEEGKETTVADAEPDKEEQEQIQYALRFEAKNSGEGRKTIEDQLKKTSPQALAVTWDETGEA